MKRVFNATAARAIASYAPPLGRRVATAALSVAPLASRINITALRYQPVRFASEQHNLCDEAKNELAEEEAREDKTACPPTPAGWTLVRKEGETRFHMKKEHNGEVIECWSQLEVADPELVEKRVNEESNASEHFPFTILITKNGKTLDFTLTHMDGELVLDGMTYYDDPELARDFSAEGMSRKERFYQGPAIAELSSSLVSGMISFLETRGIDDDFAAFVAQYCYWLEQTEYENWLRKVAQFTS